MKKAIVLVLVLIVVFSSQLFSETLDCQQSFELGKVGAKEEHKIWGWCLLGIGTGILGGGAVFVTSVESADKSLPPLLFVIQTATFVPALVFPTRNNISPRSSGVDLECYRDGYKRRARWKNLSALLLCELPAFAVSSFLLALARI